MNLVLTKQSQIDLDEIWDYFAQDNIEVADRFIGQVFEKCLLLAESPKIG